ncbi:hypothetical protein [Georgenia wangjunii]|uniref:hypothetical protein n=1 Tax=Georgenia wangjunii TaxID=3117730 RepID=UPI002F260B39
MSSAPVVLVEPAAPMHVSAVDPLLWHREARWRIDLLNRADEPIGTLGGMLTAEDVEGGKHGVGGGSFEYSIHNVIRSTGSLTYIGEPVTAGGEPIDWHQVRIQPWYILSTPTGEREEPMGVFIPAAPKTAHTAAARTQDIELYDKLLTLDRAKVKATHTYPAGTVVTTAVAELIASVGETRVAVTESTETLSVPMVWGAGTTKLKIINELLEAANYLSVWVDGYGVFRADPYVRPSDRGTQWAFVDGAESIYLPDFTHDSDGFDVPNEVVLVATSDGETEALVGYAVNEDPESRWSVPNQGPNTVTETGVEATSQAVLDNLAARRLVDLTQVASTFEIRHAWVPSELNDAVLFRRAQAGITGARCVVQKRSFDMATGALVTATLREVTT